MFRITDSLEKRQTESARILKRYPNRIPVIVENLTNESIIHKFLVPCDCSLSEFVFIFRKRNKLDASQAMFFSVLSSASILSMSILLSQLYKEHKHTDGFLYLGYQFESTFGTF